MDVAKILNGLNNLGITTSGRGTSTTVGKGFDKLQSLIANGGRDSNCKFYYNNGAGGSIIQVAAKSVVGGFVSDLVSDLKDLAINEFNSLFQGKKEPKQVGAAWAWQSMKAKESDEKSYGRMTVNDGKATVYALDDWGCVCTDGLMLGIKVDQKVNITQSFPNYRMGSSVLKMDGGKLVEDEDTGAINIIGGGNSSRTITNTIKESDTLVWYDTTAIVTISSDKNIITTRVTGRDYSRKELVSNGDIKFSVSGQITSGRPDVFPTAEVQKFIKVMQYKGIVKINNQLLDQFGISHIVITDFSLSPKEGGKALQPYSFSAIGLQPEKELAITDDTVTIISPTALTDNTDNGWISMLKNQLDGLKGMANDLFSQGTALATGMLDGLL